jgi:transcriptional regulator CtsR
MGDDEKLMLSRNELANFFSCAPSQINYVLSTRFTPERGFIIESRRGGGGFITVIRISVPPESAYDEFLSRPISEGLSYVKAGQLLERMTGDGIITAREAGLLRSAISDKALVAPTLIKDGLRASIMKSLLLQLTKLQNNQSEV